MVPQGPKVGRIEKSYQAFASLYEVLNVYPKSYSIGNQNDVSLGRRVNGSFFEDKSASRRVGMR